MTNDLDHDLDHNEAGFLGFFYLDRDLDRIWIKLVIDLDGYLDQQKKPAKQFFGSKKIGCNNI